MLACATPGAAWEQVAAWIAAHRDELLEQAATCGAILFRGFPLATAEDFDRCVAAFDLPNFPYDQSLSNAVRVNRTPRVFTANEAPATVTIFLHHEMAQTPVYPSRLFFFCEQAAESGGRRRSAGRTCCGNASPSAVPNSPAIAQNAGCAIRTSCRRGRCQLRHGAKLAEHAARGKPGASRRALASARLPVAMARRWLLAGDHATFARCARAGRWSADFLQSIDCRYNGWRDTRNDPAKAITHGDGSPLDAEAVATVAHLAGELTFDLPWQTGDVALVDNFVTMHGRRPFNGTRRVLASLVAVDS